MENLIFALNSTFPIFVTMVVGMVVRKLGFIDEEFIEKANKLVFNITLPCLLFYDLAKQDFVSVWNGKFVLFCVSVTMLSVFIGFILSYMLKEKNDRGEFIQAVYRSSSAILGIAFIMNMYGNAGMAPMMVIGSVPLYNAMAVVILYFTKPDSHGMNLEIILKTLKAIITNPVILSIFLGMIWSFLDMPKPEIFMKSINNLAVITTPLGIISMGAAFDIKVAGEKMKTAVIASFVKLIGLTMIFLPLAIKFGFRNDELVAILIMIGSPTTVNAYIMSKNTGHEGTLSIDVIMLTTLGCSVTLTFWLFLLKSGGFI